VLKLVPLGVALRHASGSEEIFYILSTRVWRYVR